MKHVTRHRISIFLFITGLLLMFPAYEKTATAVNATTTLIYRTRSVFEWDYGILPAAWGRG